MLSRFSHLAPQREDCTVSLHSGVAYRRKHLGIPDALSRAPFSHLRAVISINAVASEADALPQDCDRTLQDLQELDFSYNRLRDCMASGFPPIRYDLHNDLLPFCKLRDSLSTDGNLVLDRSRIIVPAALCLHDSHKGVEATKRRARQTVFWSGTDSDISNKNACLWPFQVLQPSLHQEPLLNNHHLTRPFESVSSNFPRRGESP